MTYFMEQILSVTLSFSKEPLLWLLRSLINSVYTNVNKSISIFYDAHKFRADQTNCWSQRSLYSTDYKPFLAWTSWWTALRRSQHWFHFGTCGSQRFCGKKSPPDYYPENNQRSHNNYHLGVLTRCEGVPQSTPGSWDDARERRSSEPCNRRRGWELPLCGDIQIGWRVNNRGLTPRHGPNNGN